MELCGGADTNTDLHWVLWTFNGLGVWHRKCTI